jgi:hypothetical protein
MASGQKTIVINTQERAVSTDINTLQAYEAASSAELLRYMLNVTSTDDLDAAAVITEPSTLTSPLTSEIINGLMVSPQGGSLSLFVTPGVMMAIAPDSDPNASNYKFVKDIGVTTLGALPITANSSGSTRIDVIECQLNPVIAVTDSRDIFNPSTNLFSASVVTKAVQTNLTYRVRAGTPGSGFPGLATGWLPLAVASVPTGTTTVDTVTFWDVRPLISDREFQPFALQRTWPRQPYARWQGVTSPITGAANWLMSGMNEVSFSGRRYGGEIRRGTPGTDNQYIDLVGDSANWANGFSLPAGGNPVFLYLMAPFGLPRWARYTDSGGTRKPRSPRGIYVLSTTSPDANGFPTAAIGLPSSCGFSATDSNGVCVFMAYTAYTPIGGHNTLYPSTSCNKEIFARCESVSPTSTSNTVAEYDFTSGVAFPANAKRLLLRFIVLISTNGINDAQYTPDAFYVYPIADTTHIMFQLDGSSTFVPGPDGGVTVVVFKWVPVPNEYPASGNFTFRVGHAYQASGTGISVSGQGCQVWGYEL